MSIKIEFSEHILEKYSHIKFHKNPSGGSSVVPCGRKKGWTESWADKQA
jgi:hypothetical protein